MFLLGVLFGLALGPVAAYLYLVVAALRARAGLVAMPRALQRATPSGDAGDQDAVTKGLLLVRQGMLAPWRPRVCSVSGHQYLVVRQSDSETVETLLNLLQADVSVSLAPVADSDRVALVVTRNKVPIVHIAAETEAQLTAWMVNLPATAKTRVSAATGWRRKKDREKGAGQSSFALGSVYIILDSIEDLNLPYFTAFLKLGDYRAQTAPVPGDTIDERVVFGPLQLTQPLVVEALAHPTKHAPPGRLMGRAQVDLRSLLFQRPPEGVTIDWRGQHVVAFSCPIGKHGTMRMQVAYSEASGGAGASATKGQTHVEIVRAHSLRAMDVGGTSDPYCVVWTSADTKDRRRTDIVYRSLNPTWHEHLLLPELDETGTLTIEVYDHDKFSKDDFIGRVVIPGREIPPEGLVEAEFSLSDGGGTLVVSVDAVADTDPTAVEQSDDLDTKPGAGENEDLGLLRLLMQRVEVRDRRWGPRVFKSAFIASRAVDVAAGPDQRRTRKEAVAQLQRLCCAGLIRHVNSDQMCKFRDGYFFYRFVLSTAATAATDRGEVGEVEEGLAVDVEDPKDIFWIGDHLLKHLALGDRVFHGRAYHDVFVGSEAIDIVMLTRRVPTRKDAVHVGQLVNKAHSYFEHVARQHKIEDKYLFYTLTPQGIARRKELLEHGEGKVTGSANDFQYALATADIVKVTALIKKIKGAVRHASSGQERTMWRQRLALAKKRLDDIKARKEQLLKAMQSEKTLDLQSSEACTWSNVLFARVFSDVVRSPNFGGFLRTKMQTEFNAQDRPAMVGPIVVENVDTGKSIPLLDRAEVFTTSSEGEKEILFDVVYSDTPSILISTELQLGRISTPIRAEVKIKLFKGRLRVHLPPMLEIAPVYTMAFTDDPEWEFSLDVQFGPDRLRLMSIAPLLNFITTKVKAAFHKELVFPNEKVFALPKFEFRDDADGGGAAGGAAENQMSPSDIVEISAICESMGQEITAATAAASSSSPATPTDTESEASAATAHAGASAPTQAPVQVPLLVLPGAPARTRPRTVSDSSAMVSAMRLSRSQSLAPRQPNAGLRNRASTAVTEGGSEAGSNLSDVEEDDGFEIVSAVGSIGGTKDGYLMKKSSRGPFPVWKKRWFAVVGSSLYQSRSRSKSQSTRIRHKIIPLHGMQFAVTATAHKKDAVGFVLYNRAAPSQSVYLSAESRGEMETWRDALGLEVLGRMPA